VGSVLGAYFFDKLSEEVARKMRAGVSVCIEGGWGSGRSTLLSNVTSELEMTGVTVLSCTGHRLLSITPYAALRQLAEFPEKPSDHDPESLAALLTRVLFATKPLVLIIDNADLIDTETLSVIELLKERLSFPVCFSTLKSNAKMPPLCVLGAKWGCRKYSLPPLRFEQAASLAESVLGGPVNRSLVGKLFGQSAGNPRLIHALLKSSTDNALIGKDRGIWVSRYSSLWHPDLEIQIDSFLASLPQDARHALFEVGYMTPRRFTELEHCVSALSLHTLESAGVLSFVASDDPLVSITPPLLQEYVYRHSTHVQAQRAQGLIPGFESPIDLLHDPEGTKHPFMVTGSEVLQDAALANLFNEQSDSFAQVLWHNWQTSHAPTDGFAYLEAMWNNPSPGSQSAEVLSELDETKLDDPWLGLRIAVLRGEWYAYHDHDISMGLTALEAFAQAKPEMRHEAKAYSMFTQAVLGHAPKDYEEALKPTGNEPPGSIVAIVKAFLDSVTLRPKSALKALDLAPDGVPALLSGIPSLVGSLSLHQMGKTDEAYKLSIDALTEARKRLDKAAILTIGYGITLLLHQERRWDEAEQIMGSVLSVGLPGKVTTPLYVAMLRITALLSVRRGNVVAAEALIRSADEVNSHNSAMPGTTTILSSSIRALIDENPKHAADLLSSDAHEQMQRGFRLSAFAGARFALGLDPKVQRLEELESIVKDAEVKRYDSLINISRAVFSHDGAKVLELIDQGVDTGHEATLLDLLINTIEKTDQGTKFRRQLSEAVSRLQKLHSLPKLELGLDTETSATALSDREFEIALLADTLDNQGIANRLNISVRTVENHIYNAMRKTNAPSRTALFEYATQRLRSS